MKICNDQNREKIYIIFIKGLQIKVGRTRLGSKSRTTQIYPNELNKYYIFNSKWSVTIELLSPKKRFASDIPGNHALL